MDSNPTLDKIAFVALQILEKEGPDAVTMRRIAKSVKITPMAIYHYFADRETLLKTITDREFETLAGYMDARPSRGSAKTQLLSLMDYYLDYAFDRPRIFDYVFSQCRTDARRFPDDFRARRSPTMNRVADAISAAMESGEIRKDDVWEVAFELWAHVHGYIALYRAGRIALSEKEFRQLCRRAQRRLLLGLKP